MRCWQRRQQSWHTLQNGTDMRQLSAATTLLYAAGSIGTGAF
jgi:hypothetical protein